MNLIASPFAQFFDLDGSPLDHGYIYIGVENQNPITSPIPVYWDAAGTQPAPQPLRTLNGYVARNGSPAQVYADGVYSITVLNRRRKLVFYNRTSSGLREDLAAPSGASMIGFIQAGAGAVAETVQSELRQRVNVKQFGAVGNGAIVGGVLTGANDTAAFNAAIAYCGNVRELEIPNGVYIITPGAMSRINCSVWGPEATLIGSADSGNSHIVNLGYDETYPVPMGTGVTGLFAWKTFRLHMIIGSPNGDAGMANTGIHCDYLNESQVHVDVIRGCSRGIHLDGPAFNTHQGTNDINIGHLYMCDVGFLGWGGNVANMCEANRVTGRYWYGFKSYAISLAGGGGTAVRVDNIFDIISVGPGLANGGGILLDALCARNVFRIRSWDSGVSGTGKLIVSAGSDNLFQVPSLPLGSITSTGTDVFDTLTTLTDGGARSNMSASSVPSSGNWRVGDKIWNTAPVAGNVPGWVCTTAGTPGTWTEMQVLAMSPKFKAARLVAQAITVATPTTIIFPTASANVGTAYNPANGIFQPAVPGYYQVSTSATVSGTTMTSASISLLKNGGVDTPLNLIPTTTNGTILSGATLVYLNGTTDTIAISCTINAASGAQVTGGNFSGVLTQST